MSSVDSEPSLAEVKALDRDERDTKLFKILAAMTQEIKELKSSSAERGLAVQGFDHNEASPPDYHTSSETGGVCAPSNTHREGPVNLNVGGTTFKTTWSLLRRLQQSRLGRLSSCCNKEEALKLCDEINTQTNEYQFNWPPRNFDCVLSFLATGRLHFGNESCMIAFKQDMDYWGINHLYLEPCCAQKYNEQPDFLKWGGHLKINALEEERDQTGSGSGMKRRLWDLFDNPHTSIGAKIIAGISLVGILTSIAIFSFYTLPAFKDIEGSTLLVLPFVLVDGLFALWFTLEFIIRAVCCPSKVNFIKNPLNWIDLIAVLSYYSSFVFDFHSFIYEIFLFFRILRILRILKFAHHSTGLWSLGLALKSSFKELFMLLLLLGAGVIIFSTLAYFCEKEENYSFKHMMEAYWWAIITMTTVGYGDVFPLTILGKIVSSFCAICGVFFIGLPIPIIGYKFATFYKYEKSRKQLVDNKAALEVARKNGQMQLFIEKNNHDNKTLNWERGKTEMQVDD